MCHQVREYKNDLGQKRAAVIRQGYGELVSELTPYMAMKIAEGLDLVDAKKKAMRVN